MQDLTKTTSRKFYNKWLYKITIKTPAAAVFRWQSLDKTKAFCELATPNSYTHSLQAKAFANKGELLPLIDFLKTFDPTIWSKRVESDCIDLYTNDKDFYNTVSDKLKDRVIHRFEPNQDTLDLLEDSSTIIAKKLPHNLYNYKVYLLPHKMANNKEGKMKFVEWVKTQTPKITFTDAVEHWFLNTDWNWDRRYVLVDNEQTLLMLKLRNAEVVGKIYKYILTDK